MAGTGTATELGRPTATVQMQGVGFPCPPIASARGVLRTGLPSLYGEDDFLQRFLTALETVLDPIFGSLDGLPAHLDVDLAPFDILQLFAAWLGLPVDDQLTETQLRQLLHHASELAARRGTAAGIELALHVTFPGLPVRVEEGGRTAWGLDPDVLPPPGDGEVVVYCDVPVPPQRQAAVARTIEQVKPAHVPYRLKVRVERQGDRG